ncbi:hypothetical protein PsorP6_012078 [Peronosclerospora sorghi]|uniref:Uncharacterized protein n=1 Tax=Peronosclerospora sorghi TaxID=230839 RepID=A0ACC0WLB9_9STRA|nr:hypothetical protein PsorP6_012078 [Peronosclerospora sorghi]
MFDKFNAFGHFFPKFHMPIDTRRDNKLRLGRDQDVGHNRAVHEAALVHCCTCSATANALSPLASCTTGDAD